MHTRFHAGSILVGFAMIIAAQLAVAQEPPPNFVVHDSPQPLPEIRFQQGGGKTLGLPDFRGRLVLLNIWATWCVPCRREMPMLDRLQEALAGPDFEVVALSIDRTGPEAVRKFFAEFGITRLALYIDSTGKVAREVGLFGLPTTLLIDREGREVGRLVGPAEWDGPPMVEFLKSRLSEKTGADAPNPTTPSQAPSTTP